MPDTDPAEPVAEPVAKPKEQEGSVVVGFFLFIALIAGGLSVFTWATGGSKYTAAPPVVQTPKTEPTKPTVNKSAVVAKIPVKPTKHPTKTKTAKATHTYRGRVVPLPAGVMSDAQAAEYRKKRDSDPYGFDAIMSRRDSEEDSLSVGNNEYHAEKSYEEGKTVHVRGYTRKDGTRVDGYNRHPRSR